MQPSWKDVTQPWANSTLRGPPVIYIWQLSVGEVDTDQPHLEAPSASLAAVGFLRLKSDLDPL